MFYSEPEYIVMLFLIYYLSYCLLLWQTFPCMYFVFVIVANLCVTITDSNKSNNTALQCTSPEVSEMIYRICMQSEFYCYLCKNAIFVG